MTVTEWENEYNNLWSKYFLQNMKIAGWIILGFFICIIVIPVLVSIVRRIIGTNRFEKDLNKWNTEYQAFMNNIENMDLTTVDKKFAFAIADYLDCINVLKKAKDIKNPTKDDLEVIDVAKSNLQDAKDALDSAYEYRHTKPDERFGYFTFNDEIDTDAVSGCSTATLSLSLITLLICFCVAVCLCGDAQSKYKAMECNQEYIQDIYCMDLQNEVSGYGGRYSIRISTDSYYYYYIKDSDGYKLSKIAVEGTSIKETSGTPSLYKYKKAGDCEVSYILYVPEGTIISAGYDPF